MTAEANKSGRYCLKPKARTKRGNKAGEGAEIVKDQLGARRFDRARTIALGADNQRNSETTGGFSVDLAVADKDRRTGA